MDNTSLMHWTRESLVDFLKTKVSLFADFPEKKLMELVERSRIATYEPKEAVIKFGDDLTFFGVVLEGALAVSVVADGGYRQEIGHAEAGLTFGEMALMTGEKSMADFIARTRSRLLLIPVAVFQSMIMTEPGAAARISKTIVQRMATLAVDPKKAAAAFRESADPYGLSLQSERPEKILVVNCGSSSLKYSFFNTADPSNHARGMVERLGLDSAHHTHHGPQGKTTRDLGQMKHAQAFEVMMEALTDGAGAVMVSASEVSLVAHRVVHGGETFTESTLLTNEAVEAIEALNPLAPLHNPVNVAGIREMRRLFPAVPHVAVFDTAFHHTMPSYAYLYGLPYEYYEEKGVRRYGFHGTSHAYVCLRMAEFLQRKPNELEVVSCHLGNGSSVCAVDHGRSLDTSMGFTPGEGLIMGTRCGDLDAGVVTFLQRNEGLEPGQVEDLLNRRSGLLGLSGLSSDMRDILQAAEQGHARALMTLKAYCYRVRKYIGAYAAAMAGLDVVVFTGGVGQGSEAVRALCLQGLDRMGIQLDDTRNRETRGFEEITRISTDDSRVAVLVVPTDEERMMAREALRTLSRSYLKQVLETHHQTPIPIEVSARHVHLCQEHVEALFGPGYELRPRSQLSQPGQYAAEEQVCITGPRGSLDGVRVLGPARRATQVEISMTDQFKLGITAPVRQSGDIADTPGCSMEGPTGKLCLENGVICALRHIHMTPEDALRYGVRDKSTVRIRVPGDRELIFGDVLVRVDPSYRLAMHLDTDEANAANLKTGAQGYIESIQEDA